MPTHWCASAGHPTGRICPLCSQALSVPRAGEDAHRSFSLDSHYLDKTHNRGFREIAHDLSQSVPRWKNRILKPHIICSHCHTLTVMQAIWSWCAWPSFPSFCQYRPQWENCPQKYNQHLHSRPNTWNNLIYLKIECCDQQHVHVREKVTSLNCREKI